MKLAYEEWMLETVLAMIRKTLIDEGTFEKCENIHICLNENRISVFAYDKEGEKKVIDVNKVYN